MAVRVEKKRTVVLFLNKKVMDELTICELESYIRLCDRKREILYRKISGGMGDRLANEEYDEAYKISQKLDGEINRRLSALLND